MKQKSYYLKIFLIIECVLLIFLGIFYFSAGRSLYERDSDGNVAEFNATNDVGELTQGATVEQIYTSQMDLLDSIGVMVSDYGKSINHGVEIQCENLSKGQILAKKTFSADEFEVNQYVFTRFYVNAISAGHLGRVDGNASYNYILAINGYHIPQGTSFHRDPFY